LKETSEQEETTPQALNLQTVKTNIVARQLLRDSTKKLEVTANERDTAEGDETNRPESNLQDNSNGPRLRNVLVNFSLCCSRGGVWVLEGFLLSSFKVSEGHGGWEWIYIDLHWECGCGCCPSQVECRKEESGSSTGKS